MPRIAKAHEVAQAPENYGKGRGGRPWRRKRAWVMERDGYLCQPCSREGRLTVATQCDHIIPQAQGGTSDEDNLQAICGDCHEAKSQRESRWRRR